MPKMTTLAAFRGNGKIWLVASQNHNKTLTHRHLRPFMLQLPNHDKNFAADLPEWPICVHT